MVFKTPIHIWDPEKPIYIKRAVGLSGEKISFKGQLMVNGEAVTEPEFFRYQQYVGRGSFIEPGLPKFSYMTYSNKETFRRVAIEAVRVPEGHIFVLGDNTRNSRDGRYWGAVPVENVKGKAFMRYWPLNKVKLIK